MALVRLATFNLENLDDGPGVQPPLADRIRVMKPQLQRVNADVLCLQEVHSQGAVELLLKPLADDVLLAAVGNAIARSCAVLEEEAELLELRARYDSLSGREREVMAGVVAGNLNKHVAAALGISEITVKGHRGRVMRKMAAGSLPELVLMALRLDLPRPRLLAAAS